MILLLVGCEVDCFNDYSFKLMFKGLARTVPQHVRRSLPITPTILLDIYKELDFNNSNHVTLWAAFLISFFLLCRKSNIVPNSMKKFDKNKQFTRQDFIVDNNCLLVVVKWSKTIQVKERVELMPIVSIPGSVLCPVKAYKNMLKVFPGSHIDPAFTVRSKQGNLVPLAYHFFQKSLKYFIGLTGRDSKRYSTHGFRRGGATFAFKCKVPGELIKKMGDWKSDIYQIYLDMSVDDRLQAAIAFRKAITKL
jgi:hypothetical protein